MGQDLEMDAGPVGRLMGTRSLVIALAGALLLIGASAVGCAGPIDHEGEVQVEAPPSDFLSFEEIYDLDGSILHEFDTYGGYALLSDRGRAVLDDLDGIERMLELLREAAWGPDASGSDDRPPFVWYADLSSRNWNGFLDGVVPVWFAVHREGDRLETHLLHQLHVPPRGGSDEATAEVVHRSSNTFLTFYEHHWWAMRRHFECPKFSVASSVTYPQGGFHRCFAGTESCIFVVPCITREQFPDLAEEVLREEGVTFDLWGSGLDEDGLVYYEDEPEFDFREEMTSEPVGDEDDGSYWSLLGRIEFAMPGIIANVYGPSISSEDR